ncbi:MAG: hypothetical protein ABIH20_06635 [Candidatus Diapherotrites archaeon]
MIIVETLLFDTYAIMEIMQGNPNYKKFTTATPIINDFILSELCYSLLKTQGKKTVYTYTNKYAPFSMQINSKIIRNAMNFRYKNRKKNLNNRLHRIHSG